MSSKDVLVLERFATVIASEYRGIGRVHHPLMRAKVGRCGKDRPALAHKNLAAVTIRNVLFKPALARKFRVAEGAGERIVV